MPAEARYTCQMQLPGFGIEAQAKLGKSKVLLVGAGGLGCPAAQYLAAAGVGTLAIVDFDTISRSNLHRQILFGERDIGKPKAVVAAARLGRQNPGILISALTILITAANVRALAEAYDIVVDCTDNFEARYLLNDACVLAGKPLVYGAAYQYQGQVAVWNAPNNDGTHSPHYRDMFPSADSGTAVDCDSGGVVPTLTGVIGCLQANEVIKYLAGLPGLLASRLLIFDALTMESHTVALPKVSSVPITSISAEVPTISAAELKAALADRLYELVDVRTADQHASFNVGGTLMPLEDILSGVEKPDASQPLVFYCATGKRSAAAARHVLATHPNATVFSLEGGITAWQPE